VRGLLFESDDGRLRFLVRLGGPTVIVGRRPPPAPHHVTIPDDARVSRHHLRISGELVLEDTSSGGVYMGDGTRVVGPTQLGPGAVIVLNSDLRFTARAFEDADLADERSVLNQVGSAP